jgi:hypothetical protein
MSETRKLAAIRSQISLAIAGLVARLAGIAQPGAIYLSEDDYRQVKQRLDLKVTDLVQLKNIADGPRLFARSRQAGRTELAPTFAAIGTAVTAALAKDAAELSYRRLCPRRWSLYSARWGGSLAETRAAARIGPLPSPPLQTKSSLTRRASRPSFGADRRSDSTSTILRGVALGCPRTRRVRGQNNVGICFRGYSGPQTVVYSG